MFVVGNGRGIYCGIADILMMVVVIMTPDADIISLQDDACTEKPSLGGNEPF